MDQNTYGVDISIDKVNSVCAANTHKAETAGVPLKETIGKISEICDV